MKDANILVGADGFLKITDVGQCGPVGPARQEPIGTPGWQAPELRSRPTATKKTDIYGIGGVAGFMILGMDPETWTDRSRETLRALVGEDAASFIFKCVAQEYGRLTSVECLEFAKTLLADDLTDDTYASLLSRVAERPSSAKTLAAFKTAGISMSYFEEFVTVGCVLCELPLAQNGFVLTAHFSML